MSHKSLPLFFSKYPQSFTVMTAIKMIDKKVDEAKNELKENKDDVNYLKLLAEAHLMIHHLFGELGIDPNQLV